MPSVTCERGSEASQAANYCESRVEQRQSAEEEWEYKNGNGNRNRLGAPEIQREECNDETERGAAGIARKIF